MLSLCNFFFLKKIKVISGTKKVLEKVPSTTLSGGPCISFVSRLMPVKN